MHRKLAVSFLAALALLLAAAPVASAHKMMALSRVYDDGTVLLQAFFPDGKPARGVSVEVHRADGALFMSGQTDDKGKLTVSPDGVGEWVATFTGSTGHQTKTRFVVQVEGPPTEAAAGVPAARAEVEHGETPEPGRTSPEEESLIRTEPFPWANALAGLGFIFGLSALLMCLKLRADVKRLSAD